jgi:hypothetical protein
MSRGSRAQHELPELLPAGDPRLERYAVELHVINLEPGAGQTGLPQFVGTPDADRYRYAW